MSFASFCLTLSATGQAPGDNSDVYLRPVAVYPDPFRPGPNILVLTECWMADGNPNKYNYRFEAAKIFEKFAEHEPWWGLEQEYTMLDLAGRPLGWPVAGFPAPQGPYYCGKNTSFYPLRDLSSIVDMDFQPKGRVFWVT